MPQDLRELPLRWNYAHLKRYESREVCLLRCSVLLRCLQPMKHYQGITSMIISMNISTEGNTMKSNEAKVQSVGIDHPPGIVRNIEYARGAAVESTLWLEFAAKRLVGFAPKKKCKKN
ncbi:hypothetical protein ACROYT_G009195 [Oculina patagonica]